MRVRSWGIGMVLAVTGLAACGPGDDRSVGTPVGPASVGPSSPASGVVGTIRGDRLIVEVPSAGGGRPAPHPDGGVVLPASYEPRVGYVDSAFVTPDGSTVAYLSWEPTEFDDGPDPFADPPDRPPNAPLGSAVLHLVEADGTPIAEVGGVTSFDLGADGRVAYASTDDPMTYTGIINDSRLAVRTVDGETITIEDEGHSRVTRWLGDVLLYTTFASGSGGETPAPATLRSYDLRTGARSTIGEDISAWQALNDHQMLGFTGMDGGAFDNLVVWDTKSEELRTVTFDGYADLRTTGPTANLGDNRFAFEFSHGGASQQYVAVLAVEGSTATLEVTIPVDLDRVEFVDALGVGPDGSVVGWGAKTEVSGESLTAAFVPMRCDLVAETCTYGDDQDEIPPTPLTVALGA